MLSQQQSQSDFPPTLDCIAVAVSTVRNMDTNNSDDSGSVYEDDSDSSHAGENQNQTTNKSKPEKPLTRATYRRKLSLTKQVRPSSLLLLPSSID